MLFKDETAIIKDHFIADGYETAPTLTKYATIHTTKSGALITLRYPGKKYNKKKKSPTYDFRVDCDLDGKLNGDMLRLPTHAAFMVDMYNKVRYCGMNGDLLRLILGYIVVTGDVTKIDEWKKILPYTPKVPRHEDVREIEKYYQKFKDGETLDRHNRVIPKETFNWDCSKMDWGLEELFVMIKFIAMQEDVNYPISKNFQGRKMPFARYIEGIALAQRQLDVNYEPKDTDSTLYDIVCSILTTERSQYDNRIDYGLIPNITE